MLNVPGLLTVCHRPFLDSHSIVVVVVVADLHLFVVDLDMDLLLAMANCWRCRVGLVRFVVAVAVRHEGWSTLDAVVAVVVIAMCYDGTSYRFPIVQTHHVRLLLVNLYIAHTVPGPEKYNTLFVGAPLGRPLGMQQTRQKNLLPSSVRMQSMFFV